MVVIFDEASQHLQGVNRSLTDVPARREETGVCLRSVGEAVKVTPKSVHVSLANPASPKSFIEIQRPKL